MVRGGNTYSATWQYHTRMLPVGSQDEDKKPRKERERESNLQLE